MPDSIEFIPLELFTKVSKKYADRLIRGYVMNNKTKNNKAINGGLE
jgi:hypothetical protein